MANIFFSSCMLYDIGHYLFEKKSRLSGPLYVTAIRKVTSSVMEMTNEEKYVG